MIALCYKIQLTDGGHIVLAQGEVSDDQVLCHPLLVDGLWDDDSSTTGVPAQHHLCRGLAVLLANVGQQGMGEDAVVALCQKLESFRLDVRVAGQVGESFRLEMVHVDGVNFVGLIQRFHGTPGAVVDPQRGGGCGTSPDSPASACATRSGIPFWRSRSRHPASTAWWR